MAGLEYRGTISNTVPTQAFDSICDDAYWAVAQPNDVVSRDSKTGKVIKADPTAAGADIYGVVAGKEYIRERDDKIIKVRTDRTAFYEVEVSAGTPVEGGKYELTAGFKLDATKTTNATVKVHKLVPGGKTVLVTLL